MNGPVRQGLLPSAGIGQQQNMLSLNPPFMQNPAHLAQQGLGPSPLGMPQNMAANPPMGMLSGGPTGAAPRYTMQPSMQQQQGRPMSMRQGQNPTQLNPAANPASATHMGMPFPSNMMQQPPANNAVRRVQSQPHMNPLVGAGMAMGMNPQTGMPGQIRQVTQQPNQHQIHQLRMSQPQQMINQQGMSADLMMRNQAVAANQPMQPTMAGRPTQVMSSLSHPPTGMQPSLPQTTFPNGPIPSQHPPQLSSSPRPNQTNMTMSTPGPPHTPVNRQRMTPDNSNPMSFMNYPTSQFPGNSAPRGPSNTSPSSYPFVSSSSPPMQMDTSQSSPSGMMHTQGGTPRTNFIPTPAQQQYDMSGVDMYSNFGMPPPQSVPSRPPSHSTNPHQPPTPQQTPNPQQQQHQQQSSTQHQQQQQQQPSMQQQQHTDQMSAHPPRPLSQPQRPPSQAGGGASQGGMGPGPGPSTQMNNTPRPAQSTLPAGGLTSTGRIPQQQGGQVHPQGSQGQLLPIAPRPPTLPMGMNVGGQPPRPGSAATSAGPQGVNATPGPSVSNDPPPAGGAAPPAARPQITNAPMMGVGSPQGAIGQGQGLIRLLQFSGILTGENKMKLKLSWWNDMIKEYFTPNAVMKLTLWKDNQRNEAKPFEIGVPILPRFFLVTTQSGVKSMTLSLDGARERWFGQGHSVVECVGAIWTYKYTNGYTITLRGPLTAHVIVTMTHPPGNTPGNAQGPQYTYKFEDFQFDANFHDKYIALDAILGRRTIESPKMPRNPSTPVPGQSSQQAQAEEDRKWEEPRVMIENGWIPGEPVNAFGIPQATMRCLELAESVSSMAELITFAKDSDAGPLDALKNFARNLRESGAILPPPPSQQALASHQHHQTHPQPHPMNNSLNPFQNYPPTSTGTLYSSASPSITHPHPPGPPSSINSPQNTTSLTNSPEKHPKTIPQQQQGQTPSGPASSPAISSVTASNTPSTANASLKRKQVGDASSPTIGGPDQAQTKRVPARKRGRTGGAGTG